MAKEQMVQEIQRLQRKTEYLEEEENKLEENIWTEQIICSLNADRGYNEIVSRLQRRDSYRNIAEWLGRPSIGAGDVLALSNTTEYRFDEAIKQYLRDLIDNHDPRILTNVPTDASPQLAPEKQLDASTGPSYRQPMAQKLPKEVGLGQDFVNEWQQRFKSRLPVPPCEDPPHAGSTGKTKRVDINSMVNVCVHDT